MSSRYSKTVQFERSPPGRSRSSRQEHDSGVGSSSSDQASTGGRPDRKFTARDREDQFRDNAALQEALEVATAKAEQYKSKVHDLEAELSQARKTLREDTVAWRDLCNDNSDLQQKIDHLKSANHKLDREVEQLNQGNRTLQREIASLRDDNDALRQQIKEDKDDYDNLRDKYADVLQELEGYRRPIDPNVLMSGAGDGSVGLGRTKRDDEEMLKERMKERISHKHASAKTSKTEASGTSTSSKPPRTPSTRMRRGSVSISRHQPYLDEPAVEDRSRPPRTYSNFTTTPPMTPATRASAAAVPRTITPAVGPNYSTGNYPPVPPPQPTQSGDYIPHPLPPTDPRSSNHSKRRSR